jgi:short-subunit dehydrogenase
MTIYKGATALVTGASSGIGEVFARELARRGMDLILVARGADRLGEIAGELSAQHGVRVEVLPSDLSEPGAAQQVYQEVERRGLAVHMLINNAGFGTHGRFEELDPEREQQEIRLNIGALVDLTHAFVPPMLARGGGAVINIASLAAYQPIPYMAVYGATKAFVVSFSAALAEEYRGRGLRVLALCPGATATNFFNVAGGGPVAAGGMRTSEQVVATGLRALERGQSVVLDGLLNTLLGAAGKWAPFWLSARIAARLAAPSTPARAGALANKPR